MFDVTYEDLIAPAFYGVWNDVVQKKYPEIWLAGGRGCVDGDTHIDTPNGKVKIRDFKGGIVYAYDGKNVVKTIACKPIRYTEENLFEVELESGRKIQCTDEHRFLTDSGWKMAKDLSLEDRLFVSPAFEVQSASHDIPDLPRVSCEIQKMKHLSSTSSSGVQDPSILQVQYQKDSSFPPPKHCDESLAEWHEDVLHSMRTLLGCLYRYWQDYRLCGELPPMEGDTYLDVVQRLACAPGHTQHDLHKDDLGQDERCSHCERHGLHHSMMDCHFRKEGKCCEALGSGILQMLSESLSHFFPSAVQCLVNEDLDGSIRRVAELVLSSTLHSDSSESCPCESDACVPPKGRPGAYSLRMLSDMLLHRVGDESYSSQMKVNECSHGIHYTKCENVKSIAFVKRDYYYDMFVPFYNNYFANGILNHNSTKSSFISTAIILLMENNPSLHCVCFRKFASNLADSVYTQFEFTINEKLRPIAKHWKFSKSPLKIVNVNTNQQILFRGLDDPQKVKSLKAPFGYWGLTWYEELAEFDGIEEIRNVNQSLHRGGHYFQTFCSYNPPETTANWVNTEAQVPQIVDGKLYRKVHRSNYLTVPEKWLGKNFFIEADLLRQTNPRAYAHEYLGEVTGNGGSIFANAKALTMTDEMISQFDRRRFGLDFGFAIDPACWLAMHFDKTRRDLYIYDEIYDTGMTNSVFGNLIKQKDMGYEYLMCDSAEPKSIAEFESMEINALATQKGPDSVRFSTKYLQSLCNIYIDPIRCKNAFREFTQYEYEKTKSGQFKSCYPDKNNHAIDACLVGTTKVWTENGLVSIQDLVGKTGTTFGFNERSGRVVPVCFINVRKTRTNAEVIRVVLENGDDVTCTSDHRILTVNGYCEAGQLNQGDVVRCIGNVSPVKEIVSISGRYDVFDLEVPETHNFAIGGGMFVHNCRYALMDDAVDAGFM